MPSGSKTLRQDEAGAPFITVEGVGYAYPGQSRRALDGISLTIRRGEVIGVIGPTGAGKSSFCQLFNGLLPQAFGGAFYGRVSIDGLDTVDTPTSRLAAKVGIVFEDPEAQITATTVEGEAAFALENLSVPTPDMARRVTDALRCVGLEPMRKKHPANLSGGQKQRLSIASALALSPDVIVLDEPTSQLDPVATREIFDLVRTLSRDKGMTIIVASHAAEELAEIATRIIMLSEGRIVADGAPQVVFSDVVGLKEHHIRPPDIAQSLHAIMGAVLPDTMAVPTTLSEALRRFEGHCDAITPGGARSATRSAGDGVICLEARGLHHIYPDGTKALNGVDVAIARGTFVAVGGKNGSGKSTLIKHFLHLIEATSGEVLVAGDDAKSLKIAALAQRIGYVAQDAHQQLFCDSVEEEVAFALKMMKTPPAAIAEAVGGAIAAMGLEAVRDQHPMALSRGDRVRVAIAAVLALGPEILIFDEPTTGQDWTDALAILRTAKSLHEAGKTILLVTHHLYLLPGFADRMIVLGEGQVKLDGGLREVLYQVEALEALSLSPPQTVRFCHALPDFARNGRFPLNADEFAACFRPTAREVAA